MWCVRWGGGGVCVYVVCEVGGACVWGVCGGG